MYKYFKIIFFFWAFENVKRYNDIDKLNFQIIDNEIKSDKDFRQITLLNINQNELDQLNVTVKDNIENIKDIKYLWHFTNHKLHWDIIYEAKTEFNIMNNIINIYFLSIIFLLSADLIFPAIND